MHKKELVDRVLAGEEVERPPISFWYHFGVQHGSGEAFARIVLDYFRHYDLDFLKVMNDHFYPLPEGLEAIRTREDLQRLAPFDPADTPWREQFKALEILQAALAEEAYFLDTVFDPWQSLNRALAAENLAHLMRNEPKALLAALDVVTDNLIAYCRQSLQRGTAGIFLSIPAGAEIIGHRDFLTFVKPFVARLLTAIQGLGPMTTLHVHGKNLYFEDVIDLPAPIFNWWDRGPTGPSLASVRDRIPGCVMGGIDQTLVARRTPSFLRDHVHEAVKMGCGSRFFLANGCSIDTWVSPEAVKTMVAAARKTAPQRL